MQPEDLRLVRRLEASLLDPAIRCSRDAVSALLSDEFVEFGRSGQAYDKEAMLRSLAAERNDEGSTLATCDHAEQVLAPGVVLLTYRSVRTRAGMPDLHTLRSSIWRLTDRRWRIVFHQGTPTSSC